MSSGKGKGKKSKGRPLENGHSKKSKLCDEGLFRISDEANEQKEALKSAWGSEEKSLDKDDVLLVNEPFTCCSVKGFLSSSDAVESLITELEDVDFLQKDNDLYKFRQSPDLAGSSSPTLAALQRFMCEDVRPWLSDLTGIELDKTVDMFCARYDYTDYLLCHDDRLEGRRIAYILYLVPESWNAEDGGALDLFSSDEDGQPDEVVRSLVPSRNSLAFFEVTPKSFHQVVEVLTRDKTRLSVSGWFHGPPPRSMSYPSPDLSSPATLPPADISEEEFYSWISPVYVAPDNQQEIRANFSDSSEISLPNFIPEERFEELRSLLRDEGAVKWIRNGPANKCNYEAASETEEDSMPPLLKKCLSFFRSDAMFLFLSGVTGLKLHPLAEVSDDEEEEEDEGDKSPKASSSREQEDEEEEKKTNGGGEGGDPRCRCEVRRWSPGSYTLVRDCDGEQKEFALEARLFLNCGDGGGESGWSLGCGGFSSYVARGEDEELLSAQPEENTLALVYRDADTLGFVKRVTDEAREKLDGGCFYDVSAVYYE